MVSKLLTAATLVVVMSAGSAWAEDPSATVEIDPNAPLRPGQAVVLKSPPLASLMTLALPLVALSPLFVLKNPSLSSGLVFGTPALAAIGDIYAGDPWRALSVGLAGPLCALAGWGAGMLYATATADVASRASFSNTGLTWGYGLFLAWAAADAYVTADLANKRALNRAGITEP
jgi:hypothetical protein